MTTSEKDKHSDLIPFFQDFLEIDSISRIIRGILEEITGEEKRLEFVKKQVSNRESLKTEHESERVNSNQELKEAEKELATIDHNLEQAKNNLGSVTNNNQLLAVEKEIETLSPRKDELEELIFSLMEKTEELDVIISEDEGFIKGATETVQEIGQEVQAFIDNKNAIINEHRKRINGLLKELPSEFQSQHETLTKGDVKKNFITLVKNNICGNCNVNITRNLLEEADRAQYICHCPCCNMVIMPYRAL